MKVFTLAAALLASLFVADFAAAAGRRGCPGGNCSVQAPVQKAVAQKEPSPSDAPQAAAAEGTAPQVATSTAPRTRRVAFNRLSRRAR